MDQMELRSGKALVKTDNKEDSENDFEEEVQDMLEGHELGGIEEEEIISPRVIGVMAPTNRPPPLSAMDTSSVRYPPTSAMASSDQTSTRGLTRRVLEPHRSGKFNINMLSKNIYCC